MKSEIIRQKFLEFFEKRGHTIVPSSSLIPDDPSVLLTTAGMQQFKPYYTGKLDPEKTIHPNLGKPVGKNAVSIQKSFRTSDIDAVGDESHLTFFEMLGNFSFGGYFKEDAIKYAHEFITKEMNLKIDYVSVFGGDSEVPADTESEKIWKSLGIANIKRASREDNFWGPTGNEGPCGPTTEIYIRGVEVWNIVFNEYYCHSDKRLEKLKTPGVDTGMGLERLAMVSQGVPTIFETDLFDGLIKFIKKEFSKSRPIWSQRVVADHARAITFLIADGVQPSNKEQGSILRGLILRSISHLIEFQLFDPVEPGEKVPEFHFVETLELVVNQVIEQYGQCPEYRYLQERKNKILDVVKTETLRFLPIKEKADKLLESVVQKAISDGSFKISGKDIFDLVTTHGIPLQWVKDVAQKIQSINLDIEGFERLFKKHQEISRAGQEKKFGGHGLLLNTGELKAADENELKIVTRLHTATHLLQAALRAVLGEGVKQMGSDITVERTRFDFTFPRKLTQDEIKKVEDWVNEVIQKDLLMQYKEMPIEEAKKTGALYFFKEKYPEKVKVYFAGESFDTAVSKEFCGGPHVTRTGEIGKFRIIKEEAVGAGVRRIRGAVE